MAKAKLEGRFVASTPEQVRVTEEALVLYTKESSAPLHLTGQPSSFRLVTKVWLGFLAASVGVLFVGGEAAIPFGVFGLVFFIPAILITGINDLAQPSARDRSTPIAAMKCYFRGVRWRRWRDAFAALGRPAHDEQVTVPRIKALKSERDTLNLGTVAQLNKNTLPQKFPVPCRGISVCPNLVTGDSSECSSAGQQTRLYCIWVKQFNEMSHFSSRKEHQSGLDKAVRVLTLVRRELL